MPKFDKDEALREVRKLLGIASEQQLTLLKKDLAKMSPAAVIQFYEFLKQDVVGPTE